MSPLVYVLLVHTLSTGQVVVILDDYCLLIHSRQSWGLEQPLLFSMLWGKRYLKAKC